MRPIDRILNREVAETPTYSVRPFGTTPAEAAATDTAAAAASSSGNLTTGGVRVKRGSDEVEQ